MRQATCDTTNACPFNLFSARAMQPCQLDGSWGHGRPCGGSVLDLGARACNLPYSGGEGGEGGEGRAAEGQQDCRPGEEALDGECKCESSKGWMGLDSTHAQASRVPSSVMAAGLLVS